jgi:hypothetical protein
MKQTLDQALKAADLERLIPVMINYADNQIRRYLWRGFRLNGRSGSQDSLAAGRGADDFVMEAFDSLLTGTGGKRLPPNQWSTAQCFPTAGQQRS